jgi:hypothetical protein
MSTTNGAQPITSGSTAVINFIFSLPAVLILGVIAIGLWVHVFITTSTVISDGSSWPSINGQVKKVIGSTMMAMFVLLIASLIYFLQDQARSIYVVFILVALTGSLSYSAMAASSSN